MANRPIDGVVLVTGGGGYLGTHLVHTLLNKYDNVKVRVVSRTENQIARLTWICSSDRLEPVIGDIRDASLLRYVLRNVDCLVHLAAMKHLDWCEKHPLEATTTNVVGTMNLLEYFEGETFLGISTDKSLEPAGCYGATKLLMEKLILERARYEENKRYMIVRSGNIIASSGSVVERWRHDIETSNEIVVTDLEMTRFFTGVDALSEFIVEVMEKGVNGNIYIPLQKAAVLKDLANAVIAVFGNKDTRLKVVGLRDTEKVHEKLFLSWERVVTDLPDNSSQGVEKMEMEEIVSLLRASMKWHDRDS